MLAKRQYRKNQPESTRAKEMKRLEWWWDGDQGGWLGKENPYTTRESDWNHESFSGEGLENLE